MKVWIVRDNIGFILDVFNSAERVYSHFLSEVKRWADEYPDRISSSDKNRFINQLINDYQNHPSWFFVGDPYKRLYLKAEEFDVKS